MIVQSAMKYLSDGTTLLLIDTPASSSCSFYFLAPSWPICFLRFRVATARLLPAPLRVEAQPPVRFRLSRASCTCARAVGVCGCMVYGM